MGPAEPVAGFRVARRRRPEHVRGLLARDGARFDDAPDAAAARPTSAAFAPMALTLSPISPERAEQLGRSRGDEKQCYPEGNTMGGEWNRIA